MKDDVTVDRLRDGNPVPHPDRLDINNDTLLLMIDERSGDMSTRAERAATRGIPDLSDPKPPKRRAAWVAAAGAFVVVLVVGLGVALLVNSGSEHPPSSDPPPPPTDEPLFESAGDGDAVLEFEIPEGPAVMILSHAGSTNFEVMSLDPDLNNIILHVNKQGTYEGTRTLQVAPFESEVAGVEIMADGAWTIEIRSLAQATTVSCVGGYAGAGDDVIVFTDLTDAPGLANVAHRGPATKAFDILAWDDAGNESLLVTAGGDHEAIVEIPPGFRIWDIMAGGTWTVSCS